MSIFYFSDTESYEKLTKEKISEKRILSIYPALRGKDAICVSKNHKKFLSEIRRLYTKINFTSDYPVILEKESYKTERINSHSYNNTLAYCTSNYVHNKEQCDITDKIYDKSYMHEFFIENKIETIDKKIVFTIDDFIREIESTLKINHGVVLKKLRSELGKGNYFLKDSRNIYDIINILDIDVEINNGIIIEPWLPDEYRFYNYQYLITNKKETVFLGFSEQLLHSLKNNFYETKVFLGNKSANPLNQELFELGKLTSERLMKKGYTGVVGVDLYSNGLDSGVVEVNCRFNTGTVFYLMSYHKKIEKPKFWKICEFYLEEKTDIKSIVNTIITMKGLYDREKNIGILPTIVTEKSVQFLVAGNSEEETIILEKIIFSKSVFS